MEKEKVNIEFGNRLEQALYEKRLKKIDIYKNPEINISGAAITRWVHGYVEKPNQIIVKQIADFLDVDFEWLLTGRGDFPPTAEKTKNINISQPFQDPEIQAMNTIAEAMSKIDPEIQGRVLKWACERFN